MHSVMPRMGVAPGGRLGGVAGVSTGDMQTELGHHAEPGDEGSVLQGVGW